MFRDKKIWPIGTPYLKFSNVSKSNEAILKFNGSDNQEFNTIQYSFDNEVWETASNYHINVGLISFTLQPNSGNVVYVRGIGNDSLFGFKFDITGGEVECSGNIMSLLDYDILPRQITTEHCFRGLFSDCSLVTAPELPATKLSLGCYEVMFQSCSLLKVAPKLPATTLAEECYNGMFNACVSLSTSPELPATTLANSCYSNMFMNCDSLKYAPVLPALKLKSMCYASMFNGCDSLQYVKMMATDVSANLCLNSWLNGVNTTSGTFIKNKDATWDFPLNAGIPSGWTIQTATS